MRVNEITSVKRSMAGRLSSFISLRHGLRRGSAVLCAVALFLSSNLTVAEESQTSSASVANQAAVNEAANRWLTKMNQAFSQLDYDGFFSFWSGGNLASLRVVHMAKDGIEHERLVHLNGAPREIVRDGDKVLCILQPGDRLVAMGGSIPSGPFARAFIRDFSDVSSHYALAMKGEGRIASRPAVRMVVEPRDKHRYGYRLWLDKETGLLLKSELMDERSKAALEVFQFNFVTLGTGVDEEALTPERPSGSVVDHLRVADKAANGAAADVKWQASWLPDGFKMAASDLRHAPATKQDVSTLMYSDGLAAVSVFIENMPNAAATNMLSRKGATVSVTRLVHGPNDGRHLVTVIGEVPPKTASAIAANISYAQ